METTVIQMNAHCDDGSVCLAAAGWYGRDACAVPAQCYAVVDGWPLGPFLFHLLFFLW